MPTNQIDTEFDVSCVDSVGNALKKLGGISEFDIDLEKQTVKVTGSVAPSEIVKSIQDTGKDAIIRGAGTPDSAAVCILESFDEKDKQSPVKGLARIVSVSKDSIVVDLTINGVPKGEYYPSFRESGNLFKGALSTGKSIHDLKPLFASEASDKGSLFSSQEFLKAPLSIGSIIGRSIVVSPKENEVTNDSLVGVIARSAGVWQNDKYVCSCTGQTIWQERAVSISKGIN
ncbi:unnamed protein product [[Candida] boidinii]|uniref:Superoxide dismutase 1 copper chaperone n=1 Tax=Candida boidinii TaxID=5477 RepID=A0A9W6WA92_CANBO|nr:unnamed protein product [[Candida] boidinii]GME93723.1 unnamed protein product [[Candida] boidinii]GMF50981.1 unnamed protein product [[Candida] boidinii]GMF98548.1 unnamed protein product [[Candida] boidinii]